MLVIRMTTRDEIVIIRDAGGRELVRVVVTETRRRYARVGFDAAPDIQVNRASVDAAKMGGTG